MKIFGITGIYFYDGIVRLLVTAIVSLVVIISIRKWLKFDYKDICLALCVGILCNMIWLSLCVVSLDRSLSVFFLCYLSQENEISEDNMEQIFQDKFIEEYDMLGRRYDEQYESGNIEINDGYISLTKRGEFFVKMFKSIGKLYALLLVE